MKPYKTLLFDIDDTLLDFKKAEKSALRRLFESENIPFTDQIKTDYEIINKKLWTGYEQGSVSRKQVLEDRFSLVLEKHGYLRSGKILDEKFRHFLTEEDQIIDGAHNVIQKLSHNYQLCIVTNGVADTQYKRLENSKLLNYFEKIFISDETGYQKPMPEFFHYAFERIDDFRIETSMIIGDSLQADIKGGNNVDLDSCWVNPSKLSPIDDIRPTYEISKLEELYDILETK